MSTADRRMATRTSPLAGRQAKRPAATVALVPERPAGGTAWQTLERLGVR
ncbi:hypothetical protein AB0L86_07825 [Micromonospora musae]